MGEPQAGEADLARGGPHNGCDTADAARVWLGDGSRIQLRPTQRNHVWTYNFVMDRTVESQAFQMLTIVDEFARECLTIDIGRKLTGEDVLEWFSDLLMRHRLPDHLRSDNGGEFTAMRARESLGTHSTLCRRPRC